MTVSVSDNTAAAESDVTNVETLILGAGVSGIAALARLVKDGLRDVVVIDRADGPGGTWRHNTYPGCAVDIPTHVYSFSWAPNPDWSRLFAEQGEVLGYLERVVDEHGLRRYMRFGVEVQSADWNESAGHWDVVTTAGRYAARHFICAPGPLHEPQLPAIPGPETFAGESFHSSQWPDGFSADGKQIVVIGTGASALQFVPEIQPDAAEVMVLQRTPAWVMPKIDWRTSRIERAALRRMPWLGRLYRDAIWRVLDLFFNAVIFHPRAAGVLAVIGRWNIRRHFTSPELRELLTPSYAPTCKRLGLSNGFYQALAQPNVEVIGSHAVAVHPDGVETADGRRLKADVIIYGTGFHTLQTHPVNDLVRGRSGSTLQEVWKGSPTAYMGTSVADFPNLYYMFGPNVGTISGFVMAEAQANYVLGAIRTAQAEHASLVVRGDSEAEFVEHCDSVLTRTALSTGGCSSYYLADDGRVSLAWPGTMRSLSKSLAAFDPDPYERIAHPVADEVASR